MKNTRITFIGGGNMSSSLIGGLLETGLPASNICFSDPDHEPPATRFLIEHLTDNRKAIENADVVVLAVKPQIMPQILRDLGDGALPDPMPLFISIAAGIRLKDIARWLGAERPIPIVRVMPNTPALLRSGASGLFAGPYVNSKQRELSETILRAVGITVWVTEEAQIDIVTALSGSGPAYFFLLIETLEKAAIEQGLSAEAARLLTLQTALGASRMALESREDAAQLRAKVTSKGGTTEQAINTLLSNDFEQLVNRAVQAARQRAAELAEQFGES